MDDYIRREDATKALTKLATDKYSIEDWYESYINTLIDVDDIIKTIQSADVRPAMRGRWIWDDFGYHCSECYYHVYGNTGEVLNGEYKFCPFCGAENEGEEDVE